MKFALPLFAVLALTACNNSNDAKSVPADSINTQPENTVPADNSAVPATGSPAVTFAVDGQTITATGSVLVQKDKDKLSPGNDLLAIVTANANGGSFVVNFAFTPKPGVYPVVGHSFSRDKQVFGGILGGQPKLTNYKVNLTKCDDLGSNNLGGHKWLISGNVEGDMVIPAMSIMKMDTSHPDDIRISKISFSNLSFDDNWEQLLEEGMKKLKKD